MLKKLGHSDEMLRGSLMNEVRDATRRGRPTRPLADGRMDGGTRDGGRGARACVRACVRALSLVYRYGLVLQREGGNE